MACPERSVGVDQQLTPALRAFPHAGLKADQLLLALRRGSDEHQHALGPVLHPGLEIDAVGPQVHVLSQYGWRSAIFSPEMPIVPQYRDQIRRVRLRRPPIDEQHAAKADEFIEWHFRFIDGSVEDLNEETTLPWVVERAEEIHQRDGLDVLVIDPWNEVDHTRGPHESSPDYIGRAIRMLKRFAKERQVVVIVVAHPTKEVGKDGHGRMPTPYDIEGSAHWYNKPDHIVIVHRPDEGVNETVIRIAKVRFEVTGAKGHVSMAFNKEASRYEMLDWRGNS